jgi:hypothetical protein
LDTGGRTGSSRRAHASASRDTRRLDGILGANGYNAFLFEFFFSRQGMQVPKTLLLRSAAASLRKKESKRFCKHEEQYLESILDINAGEL